MSSSSSKPVDGSDLRLLVDAPAHHLRAALLRVVESDATIKASVLSHLQELAASEPAYAKAGFSAVGTDSASRKRKAEGDQYVCEQCESTFSEQNNSKYACNFHDGECLVHLCP